MGWQEKGRRERKRERRNERPTEAKIAAKRERGRAQCYVKRALSSLTLLAWSSFLLNVWLRDMVASLSLSFCILSMFSSIDCLTMNRTDFTGRV
jgi:hypothetical protein